MVKILIVNRNKTKETMNMTIYSYLKSARERCCFTQSDLAEKAGVSITTIQNWEKDTLPDKSYWKIIIEQLKIDKDEFMRYYVDSVLPPDDESVTQPFPDFLFPGDLLSSIKKMRLTADEQELLGLEALYGVPCTSENGDCTEWRYDFHVAEPEIQISLPYDYVCRVGSFRILALHDSLTGKIGGYRDFVVSQIKKHSEETFDILKCSPVQLFSFCKHIRYVEKDDYYRNESIWGDKIQAITKLLMQIEEAEGSLVISETKHDYSGGSFYADEWTKLEDYSSFIKRDGNLRYKEFTKLTEKECQDAEYVEAKEKYEKDNRFYEEYSSMVDHCPQKPAYKGTRSIEMTERGKQLLNWYKSNF